MALAKVIEVIAEGDSIERAVEEAINQASKTLRSIKSINLENIQAIVEDNSVSKYRINAKVTFVKDDG